MSWYKIAKIIMKNEVIDSHSGQLDMRLSAIDDNKEIGYIIYAEFRGDVYIQYIEVLPEYRRMKIGTKLMQYLQSLYPNQELNTGMKTDDGSALYNSLQKKTLENQGYEQLLKEKEEKEKELQEVEKRLNVFYESGSGNNRPEFIALGDRWSELYDRINEIDSEMSDMIPSQKIIV
jgi:GNAT superfamily N-acetyltransferase